MSFNNLIKMTSGNLTFHKGVGYKELTNNLCGGRGSLGSEENPHSIINLLTNDCLKKFKKHELELVIKKAREMHTNKYQSNYSKQPRYGSLPRWFNDEQLTAFFNAINEQDIIEFRLKIMWLLQTYCSMRPGEVIQTNINPESPFYLNTTDYTLRCPAFKDGVLQQIKIDGELMFLLADYLSTFEKDINECNGYLFFSHNKATRKKFNGHLSPNFVRRVFYTIRERVPSINQSYGVSKCYSENAIPRHLFSITPHSFRHYGGKKAMLKFKDLTKVRDLLRHKSTSTTEIYCRNSSEEINDAREELWK